MERKRGRQREIGRKILGEEESGVGRGDQAFQMSFLTLRK